VALRNSSFLVNLKKIIYGPPKKMPPRMVWVEGEKSKEFTQLRNDLEKSLLTSDKVHFSPEDRAFSPHITLGRIRSWEFRQIEPEERPEVNEEINLSFEVNSIEVMESQLKRGGAEYAVLESAPLKS
jgi:2'-5' RNA ligase